MTEREAIKFLVEKEYQVVMDAHIWLYVLGPMAGEDAHKYTIVVDSIDGKSENKDFVFENIDDAIDRYLELVQEWTGGHSWFDVGKT